MKYINIPGLHNSGPGHWQTRWESRFPDKFTRVQQTNWTFPEKKAWVAVLHENIRHLPDPVILIAHSLGCITVAHWAKENNTSNVLGALMVAPADVEKSHRACFETFCPVPKDKLAFPSIVVASTNDQYAAIERSAKWAACWGSKFVCAGDKGHINAQSGLDDWEEGLAILSRLLSLSTDTASNSRLL